MSEIDLVLKPIKIIIRLTLITLAIMCLIDMRHTSKIAELEQRLTEQEQADIDNLYRVVE